MAEQKATNVTWHEHKVDRAERWKAGGHKGAVLWFTGLSACGKSTIANEVDHLLHAQGKRTYVLDGDNVRQGLNKNLGFSAEDRAENIRRIGEVGKLFTDSGFITLTSFVSPYRADRNGVRTLMAEGDFLEVFIDTPLELCEERDPKGLYKKARDGEIPNFTGISDPYEPPEKAELVVETASCSPQEAALQIIQLLEEHHKIPAQSA